MYNVVLYTYTTWTRYIKLLFTQKWVIKQLEQEYPITSSSTYTRNRNISYNSAWMYTKEIIEHQTNDRSFTFIA